jgi:hypothetical protein
VAVRSGGTRLVSHRRRSLEQSQAIKPRAPSPPQQINSKTL